MMNELETIWKVAFVAYLKVVALNAAWCTEKNHEQLYSE